MIFMNLAVRILSATVVSFVFSLLFGGSSSSWDDDIRDALLEVRDPVAVSQELLLVTGDIPTPANHAAGVAPVALLWTLAELGADRALLPTSWEAADLSVADAASLDSVVTTRLEEEFARIDENIAELFEAIRIGSIAPGEADRFVNELRQLVAESNIRVQRALDGDPGSAGDSVDEMIDRFGRDRVALELSDLGLSLPSYPAGEALPVPPGRADGDDQFRRLPYADLQRYVSEVNRLSARLVALEEAGYFDNADPQTRPRIMYDHLRSLRREFYQQPSESGLSAWREARNEYFQVVDRLIGPDTQARLAQRLERLEAEEDLDDESAAQIAAMQQELADSFAVTRRQYAELKALRDELARIVGGSLVILEDEAGTEGGAEPRAVVANSVLEEEHLYAPTGWNRTLLLTAVGLVVGMMLVPFRRGVAVMLSPIGWLLGASLFVVLFVTMGIWIPPLAVVVVLVGATGAVTLTAGISQGRGKRAIAGRAADRLPSRQLRRTLLRGGIGPDATGRRRVAVVVVAPEAKGAGAPAVLMSFQRAISRKVRKHGGIIFGEEGLTVFAAFEVGHAGKEDSAIHDVCTAVQELVSKTLPAATPVRCGVEIGDLAFYVSPIGGYRATGRAITYARRLAELARKHRVRALFGENVVSTDGDSHHPAGEMRHFQEQGKLVVSSAGERYAFYSLREIDRPSP
ncbi:MAG: hypothetical protein R6U25_13185 [Alkalispirochaeta sp.]